MLHKKCITDTNTQIPRWSHIRSIILAAAGSLCLGMPAAGGETDLTGLIEDESETEIIIDGEMPAVIPADGLVGAYETQLGEVSLPDRVGDALEKGGRMARQIADRIREGYETCTQTEAETESEYGTDTESETDGQDEVIRTIFTAVRALEDVISEKEADVRSGRAAEDIGRAAGRMAHRIEEYFEDQDGRWQDQEDTSWLIQVNLTTNTVTVFRGKVAVKAFACSAGLNPGSTPVGNFQLKDKLRWHELMGPSWGQWCSHITGDILFHSLPYYNSCDKFALIPEEYNQLGTNVSHGCVRLNASSAKYLFDNCPVGTTVTIFNGTQEDDPLGKPMPLFAGNWTGCYDPTDISIAQDGRTSDFVWEVWSRPVMEIFHLND